MTEIHRRWPGLRGGLQVCGTTSDAGKSQLTAGLCRVLARDGVRVAPFKAQNMALNSAVTDSGHEIGRAQAMQAVAACTPAEVAMNPILLKPTSERTSQVVVQGVPWATLSAAEYHEAKPRLLGLVLEALADLRSRFDVVLVEGAGSPTEVNLLPHDIVNLRIAHEAGLAAIVVGDIDRGGVFAALHGTVDLLPAHLRERVRGFVINKLRGDPALLLDGCAQLEAACGVPTLGVLPWLHDIALDAEDSLALRGARPTAVGSATVDPDAVLDVAVLRFPRLSNVTDLDALALEPAVGVRLVEHAAGLGDPDLVVLPGTKATVADLGWLRSRGFDVALERLARRARPPVVLGICGGHQMLGRRIDDPAGVEGPPGSVEGLGALDHVTVFEATKHLARRRGQALGALIDGYQIHHGRTVLGPTATPWLRLDAEGAPEDEGDRDPGTGVWGTSVHGLFESDGLRHAFLAEVARARGKAVHTSTVSFTAAREAQIDRIADALQEHLDLDRLIPLIAQGAP